MRLLRYAVVALFSGQRAGVAAQWSVNSLPSMLLLSTRTLPVAHDTMRLPPRDEERYVIKGWRQREDRYGESSYRYALPASLVQCHGRRENQARSYVTEKVREQQSLLSARDAMSVTRY